MARYPTAPISLVRSHLHRSFVSVVSLLPLLAALSLLLGFASASLAADLTPVHLRIAGREAPCNPSALSNGEETYVPLSVLPAIGAEGRLDARGEVVTVTLPRSKQHVELALAQLKGSPMIALSDLARLLNAVIQKPDAKSGLNDTVCLLARVTSARFEEGTLRVVTSFPVPFHTRTISGGAAVRSYVDCLGASVGADFKCDPLPPGETRALRLRAGQNTDEIARVVIELANGYALTNMDLAANDQTTISARIQSANASSDRRIALQKPAQIADATPAQREPMAAVAPAQHDTTAAAVPNRPANSAQDGSGAPPTTTSGSATRVVPTGAAPKVWRRVKPARGGSRGVRSHAPFAISALKLSLLDDNRVRLDILTGVKADAFVHYLNGNTQLAMDIPNASLRLADPSTADQALSHPLLTALHATMAQDSPPMTRITLDTTRVVGFTLSAESDRLSLELRLPRSATGALAGKVIVVDAGHGGSSTGALGHSGGGITYEKNCTLAIALRLRTALETCGAKVVMTRDSDIDVPLYDRPHLANNIHADLFISIHNDSNGTPNSATGTTTYYHMGDPSSRALATCVQDAVMAVTGLPSLGARSDGTLYASGLAVLRVSMMPAVLCEVAYINNERDRRKLVDPDFQQRVAQAMCDGLRAYVEGRKIVVMHDAPSSADRATPSADQDADRATLPDDLMDEPATR